MGTCYRNRDKNLIKHECLHFEEFSRPGTLIVIDADFVSMEEVGSHSTRLVHILERLFLFHSKKLSSGPTGHGPKEGTPFIDDHVHTGDVIVDYLTESRALNVRSHFPLSAPLRMILGTARCPRLGSAVVKADVDITKACVQEATIARRPRMHVYRRRIHQGFPDHQSVPSLSVTFRGSF